MRRWALVLVLLALVVLPAIAQAQFLEIAGGLLFNEFDRLVRRPRETAQIGVDMSVNVIYNGASVGSALDYQHFKVVSPYGWRLAVTPLVVGKPALITPRAIAWYAPGYKGWGDVLVLAKRQERTQADRIDERLSWPQIEIDPSDLLGPRDVIKEVIVYVCLYFGNGKQQAGPFGIMSTTYRDSALLPMKVIVFRREGMQQLLNDVEYQRQAELMSGVWPKSPVVGSEEWDMDPEVALRRGLIGPRAGEDLNGGQESGYSEPSGAQAPADPALAPTSQDGGEVGSIGSLLTIMQAYAKASSLEGEGTRGAVAEDPPTVQADPPAGLACTCRGAWMRGLHAWLEGQGISTTCGEVMKPHDFPSTSGQVVYARVKADGSPFRPPVAKDDEYGKFFVLISRTGQPTLADLSSAKLRLSGAGYELYETAPMMFWLVQNGAVKGRLDIRNDEPAKDNIPPGVMYYRGNIVRAGDKVTFYADLPTSGCPPVASFEMPQDKGALVLIRCDNAGNPTK